MRSSTYMKSVTTAPHFSATSSSRTAVALALITVLLLFTLTRRELFALSSTYDKHLKAEAEKTRLLQESRESYRITLTSLGDAVVATDAAGNVSFINPVAEKLTGWDHQVGQRTATS